MESCPRPVVVDAEDILWRTEEVARNLCAALGTIDAASLSDRWEPKTQAEIEKMNPFMYKATQNIVESSGIERPMEKVSERSIISGKESAITDVLMQPEEPSIEKTFQIWREQYCDAVAAYLKNLAEENMPHYEYLSQFKV